MPEENELEVIEKSPVPTESPELQFAKLQQFGRENFQSFIERDMTYNLFLNNNLKLLSLNFPLDLSEQMLDFNTAPYFWVAESAIMNRYEENMKQMQKGKNILTSNQVEIKKFYLRWTSEKQAKEKEYYATSTLQLIDRSTSAENFVRLVLAALIYVSEERFFSVEQAVDMIANAKNVVSTSVFDEEIRAELLYYLKIYQGLIYLKINELNEALKVFQSATEDKQNAVSGMFFSAITHSLAGDGETVIDLVSHILAYDLLRINFSLSNNNLHSFVYSIENACIYSIFKERAFAPYLPEIRLIIDSTKTANSNIFNSFSEWLLRLNLLKLDDFYSSQIKLELAFLERLIELYKGSKNSFLLLAGDSLVMKFNSIANQLKDRIKQTFSDKNIKEMEKFNEYLEEEKKKIEGFKRELEKAKERLLQRHADLVKEHDEKADNSVFEVEKRIKALEGSNKYDPSSAFYSAMINNTIVAVIIIIIGGFVGSMSVSGSDLEAITPIFLKSGVKYGAISFVLGTIVSVVMSVTTVFEGNKEKRKLLKRITNLKNQREKDLAKLAKEHEKRVQQVETIHNEKIQEKEKHIEKIKNEMRDKSNTLETDASNSMEETFKKIDSIFE